MRCPLLIAFRARTQDVHIAEKLFSLLIHDIPAFVIRAGLDYEDLDEEAARKIHGSNVAKVIAEIQNYHPNKTIESREVANTDKASQDSIGTLHNDALIEEGGLVPELWRPATQPTVHTTLTGSGNVLVAFLGSEPREAMQLSYDEREPYSRSHPHNLLLAGIVKPELVAPEIYRTKVGPGDTVVFSNIGTTSAWHRFDTDESKGRRLPIISLIKDVTNYATELSLGDREDGSQSTNRGFDLNGGIHIQDRSLVAK